MCSSDLPSPENTADRGVAFALGHQFERRSVVPLTELEITAYERCMGGAKPEEIGPELLKLGASCDEFACYDVEVCLDCKWNHLRRQSLHGRLHAS